MRIALFTDTFEPHMNGVARTLGRWKDALAARGHETRVFTTSADGSRESDVVRRAPSVPFWAYKELRLSAPHWPRARRELDQFAPDVVHAATPFGVGLVGRAAAREMGVPLVTSYHTSLTQYAKYYGLGFLAQPGMAYLRWFHNSGRRTFVPTSAIASELERDGFRGLSLWSRGVDTARFHPGYRDPSLRESLGASHNTTVVAYVGRIAMEKGVDVAARAMGIVKSRRTQTLFAVGGDGPDDARIRTLAPPRSCFAGRLSGGPLSAFYASADVFVFPSTTDTFGNVLLEAMASGLAIVAADVPQSREVVGGDAGVFVHAGDPGAFADAITALVDDRERLDAMRRAALARARSLGWDTVFDQLVNDYRGAIHER